MDITKVEPTSIKLRLIHPGNGKFIGLTVELVSTFDERFKTVERSITDKAMTKRVRGKVMKSDEIDENRNRLIGSVILGWEWSNDEDGEPGSFSGEQMKFTPANVERLLSVQFIRDQIEEALSDVSSFFQH